ncbi:penicillin acylase family protein [Paraflavitalea speifideaquila]|uniref:penicillin acylase family protein n=1 Tax=Paraflavitalea speifideaquila TaxID=3076558 RepID=UPI0028E4E716|nr:penicillin acylase family protein [Paraflavitalea speifideiaquila]
MDGWQYCSHQYRGVTTGELQRFYTGDNRTAVAEVASSAEDIHTGSNGFAIAPALSASGKPLLYINPHVTFTSGPKYTW